MICGTLHPTQGAIEVQGRLRRCLSWVLGSILNSQAVKMCFFNAGVLGQSEERTREKFADIEAFADIGDFMDQPVKTIQRHARAFGVRRDCPCGCRHSGHR